jgi:hypothetical protein
MVMSSVGAVVLLCVLFYRIPLKSSRSAHRLATGRQTLLLITDFGEPNESSDSRAATRLY